MRIVTVITICALLIPTVHSFAANREDEDAPKPTRIEFKTPETSIKVGDPIVFTMVVTDKDGDPVENVKVIMTETDPVDSAIKKGFSKFDDKGVPATSTDKKGVAKFDFKMPEKNDKGEAMDLDRITFQFIAEGMEGPAPKVLDIDEEK